MKATRFTKRRTLKLIARIDRGIYKLGEMLF